MNSFTFFTCPFDNHVEPIGANVDDRNGGKGRKRVRVEKNEGKRKKGYKEVGEVKSKQRERSRRQKKGGSNG